MFPLNSSAEILIWLVILIVFVVIEMVTVGLVSIWFAAGALAALLVAIAGGGPGVQVIVFILVSIVLLVATRPLADKYVNARVQKTNVEQLAGKSVIITERVCNSEQTGTAFIDGKEWTVRSASDEVVIEKGQSAEIVNVSGVKLIVVPVKSAQEMT